MVVLEVEAAAAVRLGAAALEHDLRLHAGGRVPDVRAAGRHREFGGTVDVVEEWRRAGAPMSVTGTPSSDHALSLGGAPFAMNSDWCPDSAEPTLTRSVKTVATVGSQVQRSRE
jgi:hypothetical protein